MSDLPEPLTPKDCDLRDFPHTPIFRSRLFGSSFHARATDAEWRAGVTLWLKSWDQVPAGSLPNDDIELCRLAEMARDLKGWKKVRAGALHGWLLCSDGRLYHAVVAEGVNNAIEKKVAQRLKTAKARIAALEKRLKDAPESEKDHLKEEIRKVQQSLSQTNGKSVTEDDTGSKRREVKGKENINSVPIGTGAGAPPSEDQVEAIKKALWTEGKALFASREIPAEKAGRIIGQLLNKYSAQTVLDAVRAGVKEATPDPTAYLTACCQTAAGERAKMQKGSRHNGFDETDYTEGVTEDGRIA